MMHSSESVLILKLLLKNARYAWLCLQINYVTKARKVQTKWHEFNTAICSYFQRF